MNKGEQKDTILSHLTGNCIATPALPYPPPPNPSPARNNVKITMMYVRATDRASSIVIPSHSSMAVRAAPSYIS